MAFTLGSTSITYPNGTVQTTVPADSGKLLSVQPFYVSGTWTNPGATYVIVKCVGGGGGAAGYCESGGAGGYAEGLYNISGVATVAVTVGGGGGGVGYYAAAGAGGTSSFGSYCSATGGNGSNTSYGHSGGAGGTGSGGQVNLQGGGGSGHTNSSGANTMGRGGWSYFGGGRSQVRNHGNNSLYGPQFRGAPGSGAPGQMSDGYNTNKGTPGETGIVIVYAYK